MLQTSYGTANGKSVMVMDSKLNFTKEDTLAMKGIAILILLFHHCFLERERYEGFTVSFAPFTEDGVLYLAAFSKVCVGIFVFLSAYGLTVSMRKYCEDNSGRISTMVMRRLWRLLTGFWPAYFLCVVGTLLLGPEKLEVYGDGALRFVYGFLDAMGLSRILGTPMLIQTWWYMSLAIMQIFLMPILIKVYNKMGGIWLLAMSLLLPMALRLHVTDVVRWMPIMVLGIWCVDKNVFAALKGWEPVRSKRWLSGLVKLLVALVVLCLAILGKNSEFGQKCLSLFDLLSAVAVLMFAALFVIGIPGLRRVLIILGTYSMNMFIIHNFIRARWFQGFTYSFKYWWLILLVLVVDSLLVSAILEMLKRAIGYTRFVKWGEGKIVK